MASITMTASFLGGVSTSQRLLTTTGRRLVITKAAGAVEGGQIKLNCNNNSKKESSNGRRDIVFATAAAAVCSVAGVAFADDEPKPGTPEAKKKYAPVCVTMPTARICRK